MKTYTLQDIENLSPFYPATKHLPIDWTGTLVDMLQVESCPHEDRIWVVTKLLDDKTNRLFAVWCAREALKLVDNPDSRSIAACDVAERYAHGNATDEELKAVWAAARSVAGSAADWAAYYAARAAEAAATRAAEAAEAAAARAAYYADRAAEAAATRAAEAAADRAAVWAAEAAEAAAARADYYADRAAEAAAEAAADRATTRAADRATTRAAEAAAARAAVWAAYEAATRAATRQAQIDKLITMIA